MSEQHRLTIATRGRGSVEISDRISSIVKNAATIETTAGPRVDAGIAHIFIRHTSCYFERKPTDLPGLRAVLCAHAADFPTASGMLEQEGERWVISCGGFANAAAPTDIDGFRAYLKQHAPPPR